MGSSKLAHGKKGCVVLPKCWLLWVLINNPQMGNDPLPSVMDLKTTTTTTNPALLFVMYLATH